jgi:nucleoside-diphosphate-sugar epimerase
MDDWPQTIQDESQLEELLSRPTPETVELFGRLAGDIVIIGAGGKMGPTLVKMACRARDQAGGSQTITVVSRFSDAACKADLEKAGAKTIAADLLDPSAVAKLPAAPNVLYLIGMKFGTSERPGLTWVTNCVVPAYIAQAYRRSKIVAFSSAAVYNLVPVGHCGSVESDPMDPIGEYSNACMGRERVFDYYARANGTPLVQIRLCYAVEMRYGVLADIAADVLAGRPIDLSAGYFRVIWQGDANNFTLRLLEHAQSPPAVINMTGPEKCSVRTTALRLGELMGKPVSFTSQEAPTALLSDASRMFSLLGRPRVEMDTLLQWTADWVASGGRSLGKPTHFGARDGKF